MTHKRIILVGLVVSGFMLIFLLALRPNSATAPVVDSDNQTIGAKINDTDNPTQQEFNKSLYSIDELNSLWQIVNKSRPLPAGYVPPDLIVPGVKLRLAATEQQMKFRKIAEANLIKMFEEASKQEITLVFGSGYRSYALQKQFYDSYVARDGQAAADRYSARPGTSEHQTGLSFDVTSTSGKCHLEICFANMQEGQWIKEYAHEYGFVVRYPEGKEHITGYQYEPWHLRYVGQELAAELHKTNQTLEEFFGID